MPSSVTAEANQWLKITLCYAFLENQRVVFVVYFIRSITKVGIVLKFEDALFVQRL